MFEMFELEQGSTEGPPRWRAWALIGNRNQLIRLHHNRSYLASICLPHKGERVEEVEILARGKS